jgi:hypothetical protein
MPTTFTVFSLGTLADIDTIEGNTLAEKAGALVGSVFGGPGDALLNNTQTFSPGTGGFANGTESAYDQNNAPGEKFRINGGANQTFDSSAIYNATITYTDGTTANITAVIFQDTNGNTYWAPEITANADQAAIEAKPIQSLKLDSVSGASYSGLAGDRQTWTVVTCYVRGTHILTPEGERLIEELSVGDLIQTRDNGPQPLRWIGKTTALALGKLAPVCISKGALGHNKPLRDMFVSRQHRMLLQSKVASRMFGSAEILVPAVKLTSLPGIAEAPRPTPITYYHLLLDQHEVIYAEGTQSESLLTGPMARNAIGPGAVEELETLFPGLMEIDMQPARPIFRNARLSQLFDRHLKHNREFTWRGQQH